MQVLECGCKIDVQHHDTESASILLAIKLVEWCVLHNTVSVLILGGEGSSTFKKKGGKTK